LSKLKDLPLGVLITLFSFGIVCNGMGLYGAIQYHSGMVVVSAVYILIGFIIRVVTLNPIGAVCSGLYLYHHVLLNTRNT
jgi:hypothetical protein